MKRALLAVVVAIAAFMVVGFPTGVLDMVDPEYCVTHPRRPRATRFHEERLALFPPGPECRFTLEDGTVVVAGPGWWPAATLAVAVGAAVIVLRIGAARAPNMDETQS